MPLKNFIKNKQKNKKHFVWNDIEVFIKDPISTTDFSIQDVLSEVGKLIPKQLLSNLDSIYVGQFDFLKDREVQASYENSSIFVTNEQDDLEDMTDDLVHEIAHSVEEIRAEHIYSDGKLEREFIAKRKSLFSILSSEGHDMDLIKYLDVEYDYEFDQFLYQEVGYTALSIMTANLFYSPYAATSLREYFANGFEAYYHLKEGAHLQRLSPELFKKIYGLTEVSYDTEH